MQRRCRPWLGTFVEITIADAIGDAEALFTAAFGAIAQVHRLMNAHDPNSDIGRVNAAKTGEPVAVDSLTSTVVARALFWASLSDGAFDPTMENWRAIRLEGDAIRLDHAVRIDLGGIAKGFAVDRAITALRDAGARAGLVNAGGDLAGFGPESWPVDIADPATRRPVARIALHNAALATSAGRRRRALTLDFDHLPYRAGNLRSATVEAPCAMDADSLAKIVLTGRSEVSRALDSCDARALTIDRSGRVAAVKTALVSSACVVA